MATPTHGTDAAHGAADAAHAAATPGMPQLDPSSFGNQIVWLVIALVAIYYILSKIALPRIEMILAERRGTISNDIAAAEELKSQALAAEKAYDKALADARAESARIIAAAKAEIQAELDAATAAADARIAEKLAESEATLAEIRAGAVEAVDAVAKDTAAALVAAMGMTVDQTAIDAAVTSRVKG